MDTIGPSATLTLAQRCTARAFPIYSTLRSNNNVNPQVCQGAADNQSATHAKGGKCWILQRGHYLSCSELLEAAKSPRVIIFFHQISFYSHPATVSPHGTLFTRMSLRILFCPWSLLVLFLLFVGMNWGGVGEQGWTWVSPVVRVGAIKTWSRLSRTQIQDS